MTQQAWLRGLNTAQRATLYKQIPGADIEPGWYFVTHGAWFAPTPDEWHGPHKTKREALQAARKKLGGRIEELTPGRKEVK